MATYAKIIQALDGFIPVVKYNGELFRFEIEQVTASRIHYKGKHRVFETKLKDVRVVDHFVKSFGIKDDQVYMIPKTPINERWIAINSKQLDKHH